jgi:AcrR family transcriptional regulator
MRKIAARIEYSPTTIYLYFKDKAELLDAVCQETFAKLARRVERTVARCADPGEALIAGLREYVLFGLKHPDHYRVTFMIPTDVYNSPEACLPADSLGLRTYDILRKGVTACVDAGVLPRVDVELASQSLWCVAHGLTANLIASPAFPWVSRERLVDYTLRAAVRGIRSEP